MNDNEFLRAMHIAPCADEIAQSHDDPGYKRVMNEALQKLAIQKAEDAGALPPGAYQCECQGFPVWVAPSHAWLDLKARFAQERRDFRLTVAIAIQRQNKAERRFFWTACAAGLLGAPYAWKFAVWFVCLWVGR